MIPKKYQFQTFSFFMSLMMSGVMSITMLTIELTAFTDVITQWPQAWAISMLVAFPLSMAVVPITLKLISKLVARE